MYIYCLPPERRRTPAELGAPPPCGPLRSLRNPKKLWSQWLKRREEKKSRNRVARRIKIPKRRVSAVRNELIVICWRTVIWITTWIKIFLSFPAPAAEPVKVDQGKTPSPGQKTVENGNQGLTHDEIMQKNREEFARKRMGVATAKPR